jgi:DNA-binding beta-propeller fold protein YncE
VAVAFVWTATLAQATPFVYATNAGGGDGPRGNLSQYDATSGALLPLSPAEVSTGNPPTGAAVNSPLGVAVSPEGKDVYVSALPFAPTAGWLLHYAAGPDGALTLKSSTPTPALSLPGPLAISPDGKNVYVINYGGDGSLIQYSVGADGALTAKSPALVPSGPGPARLAISPDGRNVYATTAEGVWQYSAGADGALSPKSVPMVPTSESPNGVVVSPDGQSVYVAESEEFGVTGLVGQFTVGPEGRLSPKSPPTVPAPGLPFEVAVSPNDQSVYVTDQTRDSVLQYRVGAGGGLTPMSPASVAAGRVPLGIAIQPDGKSVYAANAGSSSVSQYTAGADGRLSPKSPATVVAGNNPVEIAVSPAPRFPGSLDQCKNGGWQQFGFKNQGRCVAFVILSRICDALERHGIHLKSCPPALPRRT